VARVITDKYADHIPLTRQSRRFAGEAGVDLPVSTLSGWRVSVSTSTSGPPEPGPRARWARPSPTPGTSGTRWSSSSQTARCHLTTTHPRGSFVARSLAARTGCSPGPRAVHRPPPHASPLSAAVSWSESIRTSTSAMCCGAVLLARLWARATHGVARHGLLPDETPDRLKDLTPRAWAARYGPTVSE
jgi:hypothetical protein